MYWIPGANGLLGRALLKSGPPGVLATGRELDIADPNAVERFLKTHLGITHIINCAAFSQVDAAEEKKEEAFRANAIGPEVLARWGGKYGARLIHISTDYVFPGTGRLPLKETDPVGPCNYYGKTKLEGERQALSLGALVIRTSGLFGAGGKNFACKCLDLLLAQKELRLTEDQWGLMTYAPDLADAIWKMLDQTGLFQFANRGAVTKYEYALALREEAIRLGFPIVTESILPVPGALFATVCKRPIYSVFDTSKIEPYIKIRPWQEAMRDYLCAL